MMGTVSIQLRSLLASGLGQLRIEPTAKRIRAVLDGVTVLDSTRAMLVWEPRRIVPSYASARDDVRAVLGPAAAAAPPADEVGVRLPALHSRPVLDPSVPFAVHTAQGQAVDLQAAGRRLPVRATSPPTRTWPAMSSSTSVPLMPGTRKTSRTSLIRATRSTALTCCPVPVTSGWNSTASSSPKAPGRCCCSRPCCRPATTCLVRTSGLSWYPARPGRTAPTRGRPPTWSAILGGQEVTDIASKYPDPLHDADPGP